MRPVTAVVALVVLAGLGTAVGIAILGPLGADSVSLQERWISDTARQGEVNHHSTAAGVVDGQPVVYAPISDHAEGGSCELAALDAANAGKLWHYPIPDDDCTIHAVADPTIADYDGDGEFEVVVATTEDALLAFGAQSGEEELRYDLDAYGYTEPVVADLTGDGAMEIVTVDARGTAHAVRANGTPIWTRAFGSYVWAAPAVADFDADGEDEVAIGVGSGSIVVLDRNGDRVWNASAPFDGYLTTMAAGNADDDPAIEIVATTRAGEIVSVDGASGDVEWSRDVGKLAAVAEIAHVDRDAMVYAVDSTGQLYALDAATGETDWTTTLTSENVQMTPAPRLGDVDGDGEPELVAVTNDGIVSVVDPASGDVLDSYRRDVAIWTSAEVADVDGDGADEVFVIYGDGRVVAFSDRPIE